MLSWSENFWVLSPSGWRETFNKLVLSAPEREVVQEGKAHLLSSTMLPVILKAHCFYPNLLAGRNAGKFAHCWYCVPRSMFLHWKPKGCWEPGLVMYFIPFKGLQITKEEPKTPQGRTVEEESGLLQMLISYFTYIGKGWKWLRTSRFTVHW